MNRPTSGTGDTELTVESRACGATFALTALGAGTRHRVILEGAVDSSIPEPRRYRRSSHRGSSPAALKRPALTTGCMVRPTVLKPELRPREVWVAQGYLLARRQEPARPAGVQPERGQRLRLRRARLRRSLPI